MNYESVDSLAATLKGVVSDPFPAGLDNLFHSFCVKSKGVETVVEVAPDSLYLLKLPKKNQTARGFGREWGAASPEVQIAVMKSILSASVGFSSEDRALLLALARNRSGFNPDFACKNSSSSGLFQIVEQVALPFGLNKKNRFEIELNVKAAIKLFNDCVIFLKRKFPEFSPRERSVMLGVLFNDATKLVRIDSKQVAQELLPSLNSCRSLVQAIERN